jgi:hypothetical protein
MNLVSFLLSKLFYITPEITPNKAIDTTMGQWLFQGESIPPPRFNLPLNGIWGSQVKLQTVELKSVVKKKPKATINKAPKMKDNSLVLQNHQYSSKSTH